MLWLEIYASVTKNSKAWGALLYLANKAAAITKQTFVTQDKTIRKSLALGVDPSTCISSYSIAHKIVTNGLPIIPKICKNGIEKLSQYNAMQTLWT